jgi:hypothetical protein
VFEPGTGGGLDGDPVATGTLGATTAAYATLTLAASSPITAAGRYYFIAVNVDGTNAVVGNTFGLEVEDPSSDITFEDSIEDDSDVSADFAWVTFSAGGLYEYDQEAYIDPTATTAIPGALNEFTITPAPDLSPPQVLASTPASGATAIEPDTTITIVFSQYMVNDASANGILNTGNYELRDIVTDTPVAVTPSYNVTAQTLTLTPGAVLDWATTYRVTLNQNLEDVDGQSIFDQYGGDYEFTFVTRPEFPEVNAPTVLKNRIGSGANDEAVILIPTPSSGSFSGLSVKVFTTTGRLVKTFGGAEIETISSGRKILWDGTNDQGRDLGPGMYFVQVRVAGRKNVLKVMIVR